VILINYIF